MEYLKTNDTIGIIAPSRKISPEEINPVVELLSNWGYKVLFGKNLFAADNQFGGTDDERAADIMDMFVNPDVKAILCARGGYGTVRVLEKLNKDRICSNPKWLIGYSDITILHSYLNKVCGLPSIHATMPINFKPELANSETWQQLKQILNNEAISYRTSSNNYNRMGYAKGELVGGNLSVLFSLRGTLADIDTVGKILFIEDLDEYLYHIDRMMMNLKLGGKLANLAGLIVGGMSAMKDNTIPFGKTTHEIIADAVANYSYPVVFDFPAGHMEPNLPLIFGKQIHIDVKPDGAHLSYL